MPCERASSVCATRSSHSGSWPPISRCGSSSSRARGVLRDLLEVGQGDQPPGVADRAAVQAVQPLGGLVLVQREVAGRVPEHGPPAGAVGVHPQRDLLGHRAARHQHRGRLAEQRRDLGLQLLDHPALAVAVGVDVAEHLVHLGEHDRRRPVAVPEQEPGAAGAQLVGRRLAHGCRLAHGVGSLRPSARPPRPVSSLGHGSADLGPARAPRGRRGTAAAPAAPRTEPSACWWFSRIATIHRVVARVPFSVASGRVPVGVAHPDPQPAGLERRAVGRRGQLAVAALGRHPRLAVVLARRRAAEVAGGDVDDPVRHLDLGEHLLLPGRAAAGARPRRPPGAT